MAGVTRGERAYRDYLLDSMVYQLEALLKNGWVTTQSFDTIVQQLQFEKTNPSAAREGKGPVQAAAGIPTERIRQLTAARAAAVAQEEEEGGGSKFNLFNKKLEREHSTGGSSGRAAITSGGRFAIVVDEFVPESNGDLGLRPGEVVEVLDDVDENWSRGRIGTREGIFPKSFVKFNSPPKPAGRY
ncbi:hypothetical protein DFJ73DRAFT_826071 [Zopfochytrium polystomum]|nr:hypothetical protein DFJ73DRAFT_826071 [Zopfochytrium polystomum]